MQFNRAYFRTLRTAGALAPALACFACGHEYDYLGAGPHPGECPACGSRLVSPAGDFEITASKANRMWTAHVSVQVQATDESGREWLFTFQYDDGEESARLKTVRIDGQLLDSRSDNWGDALLFDSIAAEIANEMDASGRVKTYIWAYEGDSTEVSEGEEDT
ncbi:MULTISPECIES: hypothetical protein [Halorussus]|uniref:hypothetical protein n=1 Tax=Halorussus TaxID=1070314 RepID=UPI0020A1D232|nr:hypothetical protein [Halorussus vallis]USZ78613.1 hypothetical protein NGM07_25020 [Halorussus vallis]